MMKGRKPLVATNRSMRTVLLAAYSGFGSRYLLGSGIARQLADMGLRVVVLTPNASDPIYNSEFSSENIHIEQLNPRCWPGLPKRSRLYRFFSNVRRLTLIGSGQMNTLDAHYSSALQYPGIGSGTRTFMRLKMVFVRTLRKNHRLRKLFFGLENQLFSSDYHQELFDKYRPDLVVTTDVGSTDPGNMILREAQANGTSTAAVVLSWDNPSSKGIGSTTPDNVIAWNTVMKSELTEYHGIDKDHIFVEGVAHFEQYFDPEFPPDRADWLDQHNLDPARKTIFFGSASPSTFLHNARLLRMLLEGIKGGKFVDDCQVLVRLHPVYFAAIKAKNNSSFSEIVDLADEFEGLLVINRPKMVDQPTGFIYNIEDQRTLAGILKHSDVMVNLFSTLMLEACIFDLPVVNSALYTYRRTNISNNIARKFAHIKPLLGMDAMQVADSEDQLFDQINEYLQEPSKHREGRARIRMLYGGPNQGTSVTAIANRLYDLTMNRI